jgi:hypothetical protein
MFGRYQFRLLGVEEQRRHPALVGVGIGGAAAVEGDHLVADGALAAAHVAADVDVVVGVKRRSHGTTIQDRARPASTGMREWTSRPEIS